MRPVQMDCDCRSGSGQKFQRWQPFSLLVIRATLCMTEAINHGCRQSAVLWHQNETEPTYNNALTTSDTVKNVRLRPRRHCPSPSAARLLATLITWYLPRVS
jgi:hypothetical protein